MNLDSHEFYKKISSEYSEISDLRKRYLQSIDSLIKPHVEQVVNQGANWLDVGSGDGKRLAQLCEGSEPKLTAVEPVEEFVTQIKHELPFAHVFKGTLEEYGNSFGAQGPKFELITCLWNVIGHSTNPHTFLRSITDLLSDEGTLVFDVNNRLNIRQYGIRNVLRNIWKSTQGHDWTAFRFSTPSPVGSFRTLTFLSSPREIKTQIKGAELEIQRKFFVTYGDGKVHQFGWWKGQMYFEVTKPIQR
jgi:2-polyprenyl-3-methyl-5-hydroxy-6-metoxy-1,4-benzoquinol methylase